MHTSVSTRRVKETSPDSNVQSMSVGQYVITSYVYLRVISKAKGAQTWSRQCFQIPNTPVWYKFDGIEKMQNVNTKPIHYSRLSTLRVSRRLIFLTFLPGRAQKELRKVHKVFESRKESHANRKACIVHSEDNVFKVVEIASQRLRRTNIAVHNVPIPETNEVERNHRKLKRFKNNRYCIHWAARLPKWRSTWVLPKQKKPLKL